MPRRILIGLNNSSLCVCNNIKEDKFSEPVAIRSRLGWLIYGAMRNKLIEHHHCHADECNNKIPSNLMKTYYTLEISTDNATVLMSKGDEEAMPILKSIAGNDQIDAKRLHCCDETKNVLMPNSYETALKWYKCLDKKLRSDRNFERNF